ncbi:Ig-like domain-containing protein [Clostridium sp.]|uniref:Ig-like domain-containing protein n=1 Tax=Clostridium sp. TaxID=1506 RepID=UPI00262D1300|nr:Ig-like domain-containing protein [uncultured Clostridium sp.]
MGEKAIRKLIILLLAFVFITSGLLIPSGLAFAAIDGAPIVAAINITPIAADGKIVFGMPKISVNPTDDKGITKVEFYTKAVSAPDTAYYKVKTVTTAPYSANWATSPWASDGEYTIKVVVYDTTNQTAYLTRNVIIRNTTPIITSIDITPIAADGKSVSGIPKISVNPSADKGITKVEFYTKAVSAPDSSYYKVKTVTTAPYSANWATSPWASDGEYTIKVVVYDTTNQTAYLTRNVIVKNTIPPTNLLSTAKIGTNVLLSWTAAAGAVSYEVYEGINKVGATTIATDFMVTGLNAATNYTFTVKSKDTLGNISAACNSVTVNTEAQAAVNQINLNSYVAKAISTYEIGKYSYLLNNDYQHYNGVTQDIVYNGITLLKANPDGSKSSHCVGLTFEVFFKAMQARNSDAGISKDNFNDMSYENMTDFMLTWYAALDTPKSQGNQLAGAIEKYGLGTRITNLEEAKTGDFVDFERTTSTGHAAVFMNWIRDNTNIIGFKYWSSNVSTNGINYKEEYFSDSVTAGIVDRSQLYIGRVGSLENYKSFNK